MVSNEEIKRMLEAKRKGIIIEDDQNKSGNYKDCPQCKTKNPEKAIFCVNCGCKLDTNLNIKCPSCGTDNTAVAKFCVGCGEKLNQKTIDAETVKVKPKLQPTEDLKENDVIFTDSNNESKSLNKTAEKIDPATKTNIPEHDLIQKNESKKVCPSCHGKNLNSAKFCVVCGKNFDIKKPISDLPRETEEDTKTQNITPEIKIPKGLLNTPNENSEETDKKSETVPNETKTEYVDPVEKIKKSKELLDMGAITSEEFEHIKKKYLEQI